MKKIASICLVIGLTMSVGCGKKQSLEMPPVPVEVVAEQPEETNEITHEDFETFFEKYFSLNEDEMMLINRIPSEINSKYWENHKEYRSKVEKVLGAYLPDSLKTRLQKEYLYDHFHFPRKLYINGYLTYDAAAVEKAEIVSTRAFGENIIYEISVTTKNKVQRPGDALKAFHWDWDNNYFAKASSSEMSSAEKNYNNSINEILKEEDKKNTYLYLQDNDSKQEDIIRLVHQYWVEVIPDEELKVLSIKEASGIQQEGDLRQSCFNTSHVTRIPYHNEASKKDAETINKVFSTLMRQSKDFYDYYEKAAKTNFDLSKEIWEKTLTLSKEVYIVKEFYDKTFTPHINPYKDNIRRIEANMKHITIKPSFYDTQSQPRFVVTIPVKGLCSNNSVVYYNYKYYVGVEKSKVEFIQFMSMETIDEAAYMGPAASETPAEAPAEMPAETPAGE